MLTLAFLSDFDYEEWLPYVGPVAGVMAALLVFLIGWWISVRRARGPRPVSSKGDTAATPDPFTHGATRERRSALRRAGNVVPILVSDAEARSTPTNGWVIDRSTGGLKLVVGESVVPGTILSVRTSNAPQTIPWVQLEVKNCRQTGKEYELGCQFVRTPPWSVLLLFG